MSDHMVTAHFPIGYEFEHQENTKIIALDGADEVRIMLAGDVLLGNEVVNAARPNLASYEQRVAAPIVAGFVRQAYQKVRLEKIVHAELEPRGLNLDRYHQLQQALSHQIVQIVDQAMHNSDLRVQMLVAGPGPEHHTIHSVINPGLVYDHTPVGYGCIGTGAPHAMYSLIESDYRTSLDKSEVIDLVQKAKQRSEVAPGVGKNTTVVEIPSEDSGNA